MAMARGNHGRFAKKTVKEEGHLSDEEMDEYCEEVRARQKKIMEAYEHIKPPATEDLELYTRRRIQQRCPKCGIDPMSYDEQTEFGAGDLDEMTGYCNRCKISWDRWEFEPEKSYKQWYRPRADDQAKLFDLRVKASQCPKCGVQLFRIKNTYEFGRCGQCGEIYTEKDGPDYQKITWRDHAHVCVAKGEGSWSLRRSDKDDVILRDNGDAITHPGIIEGYCHKCRVRWEIDRPDVKKSGKK